MLIKKDIAKYLVFGSESLLKALEKISLNKKHLVFVVSDTGKLLGTFSDGDFRRWITSTKDLQLSKEVRLVMKTNIIALKVNDSRELIEASFNEAKGIDLIPLVDDYDRVVAVAIKREKGIVIGKHTITDQSRAYIIAEIGNNHNGDIRLAKHLIDLAIDAGADCVKFQMRHMASLYKNGENKDDSADLGAQYTIDLLNKFQLNTKELLEVFDYCKAKGLSPLCTPWDLTSLKILEEYGMEAYKIASADMTNHDLLSALIATGKPLICSTGMSTEVEVKQTINFFKMKGAEFVLLHCNSTYPTPFKDINLAWLARLKELSGRIVGYSGHERGFEIPIAAIAMGAKVIEKHFTIDREMEGNDHKVSLLPEEFSTMVKLIRNVEEAIGTKEPRQMSQGEMINRESLAKSLIVNRSIRKGELITRDMIEVRSPGQGLQPCYKDELVGKHARRDMDAGEYFFDSDLGREIIEPRNYSFNRPFGIPVRFHDYEKLSSKSNIDFVEFHLSYQDMTMDISQFFEGSQSVGLAIHSPELFASDHILDLANADKAYREHSILQLRNVCDVARSLKHYFPNTECPVIVVNAGGFNKTGFVPKSDRKNLYNKVAQCLSAVDQTGVEIIIQTMPPFPWHFGGQSYHNLFVDPDEIVSFCVQHGYRICFDVSHSMMACNYYKWNIREFTKKVAPYTAHMHIVDALGIDGEGVQIGEGDLDFVSLGEDLSKYAPGVQFIPEIWQGHKNGGEGFWHALEFLEKKI